MICSHVTFLQLDLDQIIKQIDLVVRNKIDFSRFWKTRGRGSFTIRVVGASQDGSYNSAGIAIRTTVRV